MLGAPASAIREARAASVSQTFAVAADAYVSSSKPSTNYGTATTLRISASSPIQRTYLRFAPTGLSGTDTKATLRMYAKTTSTLGFDVRTVGDSSWAEKTITYANAPSPSASVTASSQAISSGRWVALDVTPVVGGNGAASFALTTASATTINLNSREAGAATAPQLVVETQAAAPTNTTPPSITGVTRDGETLTAQPGSWAGSSPISYSYQWRRCDAGGATCGAIANAATATYTLTAADVGSTIRVRVTASNVGGTTTADSAATAPISASPPANTAPPTVTGTAQEGQTLSVTTGSWTGTPPLSYGYQWRDCDLSTGACADVAGATTATYTPGPTDVGFALAARVTAANSGGSTSADSAPTAVVAPVPVAPSNVTPPSISGLAQDGQPLNAAPGVWAGTSPIAYVFQWQRCDALGAACSDIAGATAQVYTLTSSDVNYTVRVWVTASNAGGSARAVSDLTALVGATAPASAALPTITGTARVGQTLSADAGTWTGTTPIAYTYQWQACDTSGGSCLDRPNATATSYVVAADDLGKTLRVVVTATNLAGAAAASSAPTEPVGAADSPPCGTSTQPPTYTHVVWIVMENKQYDQIIGSANAPYLNSLADKCGLATNFFAVAHPSLPNYIAMTSGSTQGVADDAGPGSHPLNVDSIFSQLGTGWRSLEESMSSNCAAADSGLYAVRHNPAVYYTNLTNCGSLDVPLAATPDLSARFTFITPDTCDDMHACPTQSDIATETRTGDTWLSNFMPKVFATPEWQQGHTAVFVTWDEDDYSDSQHIATLVIAPSTPAGLRSGTAYNHYSLLRTTEELLGLPLLGNAGSAVSMRGAFGLADNVDMTPPSAPTGLSATAISPTEVDLSWSPSTDTSDVAGYKIVRSGVQIGTSSSTSYNDLSAQAATTYTYVVKAYDGAGNESAQSNSVTITTPAPPSTLLFTPTGDTYVEADTPATVYGTSTQIIADNSPIKHLFVKFNVSGLNGKTVTSAKLRLHCVDPSNFGGDFHAVPDTTWNEATVNWNTAPVAGSTSLGTLGSVASGSWYEVDVTPVVNGEGAYAFEATSTSADGAHYSSKEGANPPQLSVTVR